MNELTKLPISPRPELDRFEAYQPGVSIQELRRQFGFKEILKLASNENPWGASPKAVKAYKKVAEEIFRYPESRSVDLRRAIALRHNLDLSNVIIGAGSDEIIELLGKAFLNSSDEIIVSASSFMQYRSVGNLMGARVVVSPMKQMKHDLRVMANMATSKTKFVFIANPNNPTGTYNTKVEVDQFLSLLPQHVLPIFDEAYFEYAQAYDDYPSMIDGYFKRHPMVVLRTFSKIYGLAGLRVGYGVAPESCVQILDKIRPPFNISLPAQAAAEAALFDVSHVKQSIALNEKEKAILKKKLEEMHFEVVPSATNFLLFKVHPWKGRVLFEKLMDKAVIARSVDEYGLPDYLRVTVGRPKENKKFLTALKEVINTP